MQPLEVSIFDKYGEETFRAIVNEFYNRILRDPDMSHYFEHVDMNMLRKHKTKFLAYILGSKQSYNGAGLREAHTYLNIGKVDFERYLHHLDNVCKYFNLDLADRAFIMSYMRSLNYFILKQ